MNLSQTYKLSIVLQYEYHETHQKRGLEFVFVFLFFVEKNESTLNQSVSEPDFILSSKWRLCDHGLFPLSKSPVSILTHAFFFSLCLAMFFMMLFP